MRKIKTRGNLIYLVYHNSNNKKSGPIGAAPFKSLCINQILSFMAFIVGGGH